MSKMKTGTDLQEQVQRAIDEMVESGAERGLQVAIYERDEEIVDSRKQEAYRLYQAFLDDKKKVQES